MRRALAIAISLWFAIAPAAAQQVLGGQNLNNTPPAPITGLEGQWYIDFASGNVFGPKTSGQWPQSPTANTIPQIIPGAHIATGPWAFNGGLSVSGPIVNSQLFLGTATGTANVVSKGADPTCTVDSTSAFLAAVTTAGIGGVVILPPGCFKTSSTVTSLAGQTFVGAGPSQNGGTQWNYTGSSGTALVLMGDAASARDFWLNGPATTNSVAVQMSNGIENPNNQSIFNVHFEQFGTELDVQSGQYWHISKVTGHNANLYGVRFRNNFAGDSGDGSFFDSTIYADAAIGTSAIRWESGGGLKITQLKTLGFATGLDVEVANGVETSDLFVDNSSFENANQCYKIGQQSSSNGTLSHVKINVQCAGGGNGGVIGSGISVAEISGIYRGGTYGVLIQGGDQITVAESTLCVSTSVACVSIANGVTHTKVGNINCVSCGIVVQDGRLTAVGTTTAGWDTRNSTLPVNITSSSSYTQFIRIDMGQFRSAKVELEIEGIVQGVGVFNYYETAVLQRAASGVTVTALSGPTATGAAVDVQFDTATTAGSVYIDVRRNSGGGGSEVDGSFSLVTLGNTVDYYELQ